MRDIAALVARAEAYCAGMSPRSKTIYYCVEVGLGTYFRHPGEMVETPQHWKLQCAEALLRSLKDGVGGASWTSLDRIKAWVSAMIGKLLKKASPAKPN